MVSPVTSFEQTVDLAKSVERLTNFLVVNFRVDVFAVEECGQRKQMQRELIQDVEFESFEGKFGLLVAHPIIETIRYLVGERAESLDGVLNVLHLEGLRDVRDLVALKAKVIFVQQFRERSI